MVSFSSLKKTIPSGSLRRTRKSRRAGMRGGFSEGSWARLPFSTGREMQSARLLRVSISGGLTQAREQRLLFRQRRTTVCTVDPGRLMQRLVGPTAATRHHAAPGPHPRWVEWHAGLHHRCAAADQVALGPHAPARCRRQPNDRLAGRSEGSGRELSPRASRGRKPAAPARTMAASLRLPTVVLRCGHAAAVSFTDRAGVDSFVDQRSSDFSLILHLLSIQHHSRQWYLRRESRTPRPTCRYRRRARPSSSRGLLHDRQLRRRSERRPGRDWGGSRCGTIVFADVHDAGPKQHPSSTTGKAPSRSDGQGRRGPAGQAIREY